MSGGSWSFQTTLLGAISIAIGIFLAANKHYFAE
jgi:hypothetical protein